MRTSTHRSASYRSRRLPINNIWRNPRYFHRITIHKDADRLWGSVYKGVMTVSYLWMFVDLRGSGLVSPTNFIQGRRWPCPPPMTSMTTASYPTGKT
jgi:hypothetical protein